MKKITALVLSVVLLVTATVAATVAYLTDKTEAITNTFTVGEVDITLTETFNAKSSENATENDVWKAQLIPGKQYAKDPKVTVVAAETNVDIYLFVKFEEKNKPSEYLTYTSTLTTANGWELVEDETNVYWRVVPNSTEDQSWYLLAGDAQTAGMENGFVTVKSDVTENDMPEANAAPELVYTAYAIQAEGFATPKAAWDIVTA